MPLSALWRTWFLEERPSVSLSLFRVALAATIGLHIFPTLLHLGDNYLHTAFREYNQSFFPYGVLAWVDGSSDAFVRLMAALFTVSWLAYLIGFWTRTSGLLMALGCYYFYARNSLHIGTLSYDILLVTLFLTLATGYPGDSFSADAILRGDSDCWRRKRPFFIQRLLQLQIAETFFFTGLNKITGGGNWVTDNPYYYLMHSPPMGVIKEFPGRAFLAGQPGLCYAIGLAVIAMELTLWFWLFWRRSRPYALAAAIGFHFLLLFTMHVPTIFFFLFPPQLLLFIDPEEILARLDRRRRFWRERGRDKLLYDGDCSLCRRWAARVQAADPTGRVETVDFRGLNPQELDKRLSAKACQARIHLLERGGRLSGGFSALRRLTVRLPLLWPAAAVLNLPGLGYAGEPLYDAVSSARFHLK